MTATTVICTNAVEIDTPHIYITPTLYSVVGVNSRVGIWINTISLPRHIKAQINRIFPNCEPSLDQFLIKDTANFHGFDISKFKNLDCINALSTSIKEHGKAFTLYLNSEGVEIDSLHSVDELITNFEEHYQGCFDSIEDYVDYYYQETGLLNSIKAAGLPRYYIDWVAIARDWECSGNYLFLKESYDQIHVFTNY
ncbi:antirestriction protein (plasmid) [Chondrocystis sp. NIES-4102]|nr:antirestriction protein [Chondrocystis sp. NIES-4102]BAZ47177.1 antirestriction protein [Chondrocystis sp. NIES-4102]